MGEVGLNDIDIAVLEDRLKSQRLNIRSPVEIGVVVARAISRSASLFWERTGSSINISRN